jgi:ferritin
MEQKHKPEDKQTNKEKSTGQVLNDLCKHLEVLAETIRVKETFDEKVEVLVNHQNGKAKLGVDKLYNILEDMLKGTDGEKLAALEFLQNQIESAKKMRRIVHTLASSDKEKDNIKLKAHDVILKAVSNK